MRTALLVSERRSEPVRTALEAAPDLLVLDIAGLDEAELAAAARLVREAGIAASGSPIFVRIAPLAGTGSAELAAILPGEPDGIFLADTVGRAQAEQLAARLAVAEAEGGRPDGAIRMIASVGSAAGALALPGLAAIGPRLFAICCDVAAIARDLGIQVTDPLPEPCRAVRAAAVLTARAAECLALEGPVVCDPEEFAAQADQALRDGFAAKLALNIDQFVAQAPPGR